MEEVDKPNSSKIPSLNFCNKLPKIELHAHLNGSLSDKTVLKLIQQKYQGTPHDQALEAAKLTINRGDQRTLEDCFKVFGILHTLIKTLEELKTITRDVIQEFSADNVVYLELRTTPKALTSKITKTQYIEAVLDVIREESTPLNSLKGITVKLLLSLDRGRSLEDAKETLLLAKYYLKHIAYKDLICGIDLSGDPHKGNLDDYLPLIQQAHDADLNTAIHLAEIPGECSNINILKDGIVNRIGHGTFIHTKSGGSEELHSIVKQFNIPLEICLTSNIKGGTVKTINEHHFQHWKNDNHPLALCTDDKGVFSTTLSKEYFLCAKNFGLDKQELIDMSLSTVYLTFLNAADKEKLKLRMDDRIKNCLI